MLPESSDESDLLSQLVVLGKFDGLVKAGKPVEKKVPYIFLARCFIHTYKLCIYFLLHFIGFEMFFIRNETQKSTLSCLFDIPRLSLLISSTASFCQRWHYAYICLSLSAFFILSSIFFTLPSRTICTNGNWLAFEKKRGLFDFLFSELCGGPLKLFNAIDRNSEPNI